MGLNWMKFNGARARRLGALATVAVTAVAMSGAALLALGAGTPPAAAVTLPICPYPLPPLCGGGGGGGGGGTTTTSTVPTNPDPYGPRRGAAMTDKIVYTAGSPITVTAPAPAFQPGSSVTIEIRHVLPGGEDTSSPGGSANADGSFSGQSLIPPNDSTGIYLVYLTGTAPDGTAAVLEIVIIVTNPSGAASTASAAPPSAAASGSGPAAPQGGSGGAVPAITPSGVAAAQAAAFPGSVDLLPPAIPEASSSQLATRSAVHHATDVSNRRNLAVLAGLVALFGMAALWLPRRRTADR